MMAWCRSIGPLTAGKFAPYRMALGGLLISLTYELELFFPTIDRLAFGAPLADSGPA
jgi:hypothetical protein